MTTMRIDAHQHFWMTQRSDYGWLTPALPTLYRDFLPHDLEPILHTHGVAKSIAVQAAATVAETEFLLTLSGMHPSIAAVVGWVDLLASDAPATIARLAQHPKLKGLRPMLQEMPADDWICAPSNQAALDQSVQAMQQHGLVFDALVHARHLPHLLEFARRHPKLSIVIDHAAKPGIAQSAWQPWADQMEALAALPHVACKLSGLCTEAAPGWTPDGLEPYVNHLLQHFGPARLVWGSDWPVLNLNGDYGAWWQASEALLAGLTPAQKEAIFGGNAIAIYGLLR